MSPRRRVKIKLRDIHHDDGEGNWLVSYADMMTLLFGFFVILTALSTPDAKKFEQIKEQTAKAMKGAYTKPYLELVNSLQQILRDMNMDKEVNISETTDGVDLVMKGNLFFESGSSEMSPRANEIIKKMGPVLAKEAVGFRISVEGHTDDVPMVSKQFPSNWELSSSRAGTVVRMLERLGFPHTDLRPIGLADTEPVVPNKNVDGTPNLENRALNRRILIRIQKQLPKRTV
jgi:chemotaxis protein MotB